MADKLATKLQAWLLMLEVVPKNFLLATHGGQFYTSVLVPYAVLYVNFSLPRDFLHFSEGFLKIHTKCLFKRQKWI